VAFVAAPVAAELEMDATSTRPAWRRLVGPAFGFVALSGLYLGLAGRLAWPEALAAATCAAAVVAFGRFAVHREWVLLLGRILRHVLRDCRIVAGALAEALARRRHIEGVFREFAWQSHEDEEEAASLRALVTLGLSLAPNSYVVEVREDEKRLVMHHLVPPERASEQVWLP
jgi:hypothetical protein